MTDQEIRTAYERDGYVVLRDIIDDRDLEPMRDFIKAKVDTHSRELYNEGKITSRYENESFERRYAAICEEMDILPRNWSFGMFGREFYDLYNLPSVLNVCRLLLGPEVSNIGTPALRTKLPGSMITSFPVAPRQPISRPRDDRKEGETHRRSPHGYGVGAVG